MKKLDGWRVRAENDLLENQQGLARAAEAEDQEIVELAIEGGGLGLWSWQLDKNTCAINDRWAEMLGYTTEEVSPAHETWLRLLHPDDRGRVVKAVDDVIAGATEDFDVEFRIETKDGRWLWLQTKGKAQERDATGRALRIAGINQDITRQMVSRSKIQAQQEELAAQNEKLQAQNEELRQAEVRMQEKNEWLLAAQAQVQEARDKYSNLFQYAPVGYFTLDSSGAILEVNQTALEMLGRSRLLAQGAKFASFVSPDHLVAFGAFFNQALTGGEISTVEIELMTSGGRLDAQLSGIAITDDEDSYNRVHLSVTDISERKRAEEALKASEERFRVALNAGNISTYQMDADLRYTWVHHHKFGYAPEEVLGKTDFDLLSPAEAVKMAAFRREVLAKGEGQTRQLELTHHGRRRWFRITLEPLRGQDGQVRGLTGAAIDITQHIQIEEILRETERKFRIAISGADMAVFTLDADLRYTWVYSPKPGLIPGEAIGRRDDELLPPEAAAEPMRIKREVLETGAPVRREVNIQRGPETFVYDLVVEPITNPQGGITGLIGSTVDITQRKLMEKNLWKANELLETMFSGIDVSIAYLDRNMNFIRVNRAYAQADDRPVEFFTGVNYFGLYPDDGDAAIFREVLQTGRAYRATARQSRHFPGGARESAFGDWSLQPVKDIDGAADGLVLSLIDVTGRETASRELAKKIEELKVANEELQRFAYVASHDLQEPLRMISSYLQLIEQRYHELLDKDGREFMGFAVEGAKRLQRMINSLLEYSRVETRGNPFETVPGEAALDEALVNLEVAIRETGAVVTHDYLPTVRADVSQLTRVFQNLVSNALRFRGAERPRVHVSARPAQGEWLFSVADNGIGIDPAYHEKIFVIFQRLHGHDYPGTGIGLSVAKRIVERHGGRIWVESTPGAGATFYFTLPVERGISDGL